MAIPIAAYVLLRHRDQFVGFCLAAFPPFLGFIAYNMLYNGSAVSTGFRRRDHRSLTAQEHWRAFVQDAPS